MNQAQPVPEPSLHHPDEPDRERLEAATSTFGMLADPTRLHILWLLAREPADVSQLVERTGASRTSVSQHLARKENRHVIYSISDGHLGRLVQEGLNHADHRVSGEPTHQ